MELNNKRLEQIIKEDGPFCSYGLDSKWALTRVEHVPGSGGVGAGELCEKINTLVERHEEIDSPNGILKLVELISGEEVEVVEKGKYFIPIGGTGGTQRDLYVLKVGDDPHFRIKKVYHPW